MLIIVIISYFLLHTPDISRFEGSKDVLFTHTNTNATVDLQTDANFNFSHPSLNDSSERRSVASMWNYND